MNAIAEPVCKVHSYSDLARHSRARLRARLNHILMRSKAADPFMAQCQIGALIHDESMTRYIRAECDPVFLPAPWLDVIKKLNDEFPKEFEDTLFWKGAVEQYIESLQAGMDA